LSEETREATPEVRIMQDDVWWHEHGS
jgi:hypothetical protein